LRGAYFWQSRRASASIFARSAGTPVGGWCDRCRESGGRTRLAKRTGFVFESALDAFDMTRAYAFWFHFYRFPQPLAEGLS
jgi:hypothetical protein